MEFIVTAKMIFSKSFVRKIRLYGKTFHVNQNKELQELTVTFVQEGITIGIYKCKNVNGRLMVTYARDQINLVKRVLEMAHIDRYLV